MKPATCGLRLVTVVQSRSRVLFSYLLKNTEKALRSTVVVAYPVYTVLLNMSAKVEALWIDNGHAPKGLLPVFHTQDELEEEKGAKNEETLM